MTSRGRAVLAAVLGVALATSVAGAAPPPRPAADATTAARFAAAVGDAERGEGLRAHLGLMEAQRLAAQTPGGSEALAALAGRLTARSRVPWLRGEARGALMAIAAAEDPAAARALGGEAGVLATGRVMGPLPGVGADEGAPPEPGPDTDSGGRWRAFAGATVVGELDLGDLLGGSSGDVHAWIEVFFTAARPVEALVDLGTNGPSAAWLDGEPLFTSAVERPLSDWQETAAVALAAGTHRLLLRVGHPSEAPAAMLRLVDKDGLLPAGVTVLTLAEVAPDAPGAGFRAARHLPPPLRAMAAGDPLLEGHLGLFVTESPKSDRRAAEALSKALAAGPVTAEGLVLLARAESADPNRALDALNRALAVSGRRHTGALAALLDLTQHQGLVQAADDLAKELLAREPDDPTAVAYDALRTAALTDPAAALPKLEASPLVGVHPRLAVTRAQLLAQAGRQADAARAWARATRLAYGDPRALTEAVTAARQAGDDALALSIAEDGVARRPYAIEAHILRARALLGATGDAAAAEGALRDALAFHPDNAGLLEAEGRLLLLAGKRAEAIAAFDHALAKAPQNAPLAQYRRELAQERSAADRFAVPVEEVLAGGRAIPAADEGQTYLLERHAITVFPNGLSTEFQQLVIRLDAESGRERLEQVLFPFTPGEERLAVIAAEVIHPDGTRARAAAVFDHRPPDKQSGVYTLRALKVVRFERLSPGDVVHLQLQRDQLGDRNMFGDFFGVVIPLQADVPKARVEVVIDAPASRPLYAHGESVGAPARVVDAAGGRQTLSWDLHDLPPVVVEPMMPGYGDVAAYLDVSTFRSWEALGLWYRDLVRGQLQLSPELVALAGRLVAGKAGVREQVAAIQRWVVTNTRYVGIEFGIHGFKPYRVTDIVKRGYGDCKDKASLLVALMAAVGIDARMVLVRTRDLGALSPEIATLWAFNHAIAYVPALDLYIDGTSELAGLDELPALDQGAMVLQIDVLGSGPASGPPTKIPMQAAGQNRVEAEADYVVAASGDATARFDESIRGTFAPTMRTLLHEATQRDDRVAGIIAEQHPGATVRNLRYAGLEELGEPVVITLDAELPAFARRAADARTLEVPLTLSTGDLLARYGTLAHRRQPLVIEYLMSERDRSRFVLPPGSQVLTLPEPTRLETAFGTYEQSFARTASGFSVESLITLTVDRVSPADYPAFRAFLERAARADAQRVTVTLP